MNQDITTSESGASDRNAELARYGFGPAWLESVSSCEALAREVAEAPFRTGRILRVERGECDVATADGIERVASDSLRSQGEIAPVTGDWVIIGETDVGAVIACIVERQRTLARRDPSEQVIEQVMVANIDNAFLIHGLDRPLRPGRLERFLVLAWDSGATPVVVLTKSDLDDSGAQADALVGVIGAVAGDVSVVLTSAVTGLGLPALDQWLVATTTTALLGESGSGKSTLVNSLIGDEIQETGEVRRSDAKGRHTTITRDLLLLPSGALIVDTPGIRAVGLWDADDALRQVFGDIVELAGGCRFNDCAHGAEPGCAVQNSVSDGTTDYRRLDRFKSMQAELDEQAEKQLQRQRKEGSGKRGGKNQGRRHQGGRRR